MRFTQFPLDPALVRGTNDLGFAEATPVQEATLPLALAGRDVLAAAMTGSGKTAAFALPILQRLMGLPPGVTRALVLTPTRELAAQVHQHLTLLGRHTSVKAATIFGGVGPAPQVRALRSGVSVVVATPGRLLDHIGTGVARLDKVEILVLDEADRMLDMGFLPDVRRILSRVPKLRQTLFFSATLPAPIVELSREMLVNPVRVGIERKAAPAVGVTHAVLPVPERLKRTLLLEVLQRDKVGMALVFTRTKHRANRLAQFLDEAGIACDRIHGNRSQSQRENALADFKSGRLRVLVATDIASRGIDVKDLPHVINFDVPVQPDDYIHRVGRTARAERTGQALTLVSPDEEQAVSAIEREMGTRLTRRRLEGFDYNRSDVVVATRSEPRPSERPRNRPQSQPSRPRQVARPAGGPSRQEPGRHEPSTRPAGAVHRAPRRFGRRRPAAA